MRQIYYFYKNKMKTLILDDELPAVNILTGFVKKVPYLDLALATTDPYEALSLIQSKKIDLLLLDIEMPDLSGIEFVKKIKNPPALIFTTAYEEYALLGYELDVVDYLLKPIRFERFKVATDKAKERQVKLTEKQPLFIEVKSEYQTVRIALDAILYVEGLKDYVKIFTAEKVVLTRLNLKGIMAKLPPELFVRIHRSFIINSAMITGYNKQYIVINERKIPIGKTYFEAVKPYL